MALKVYRWRGHTWQFEEGNQPDDAEPIERAARPGEGGRGAKQAAPAANKSRTAQSKKA